MAAKKKTTKRAKPKGPHIDVKDKGATADGKGKLYSGAIVRGRDRIEFGEVVAATMADARKKFRSIIRARLRL